MSVLHKELHARARQGEEARLALYREEIRQTAREREAHLESAEAASRRIEQLLQGAVDAGLSVVEISRLTGWSRPTLYRMLAKAREELGLSEKASQLEKDLAQASEDFGLPAGLYNLAQLLQISQSELCGRLEEVFPFLAQELKGFGSIGGTFLIDLLPSIPHSEKVILAPLFLQQQSIAAIAESVQRPAGEVIACAALGLLRLLPELRVKIAEEKARQETIVQT